MGLDEELGEAVELGAVEVEVGALNDGVLGVQDGSLNRGRCLDYFEELVTGSLAAVGVAQGDTITVAGVEVQSRGECYFLRPQELGCPSGGLHWMEGSREEAENSVRDLLSQWTDDHGIEEFHNPHIISECRIGSTQTRCHRVDFNGVLTTPAEIHYVARVDQGARSVRLSCSYSTSAPVPGPCRQVFGTH